MWSGYSQTKRVDLLTNGQVVDSVQLTPVELSNGEHRNQNVQFTNLNSNTAYTLAAYYDTNENPVILEYKTYPVYSIDSVTGLTETSATINISIT